MVLDLIIRINNILYYLLFLGQRACSFKKSQKINLKTQNMNYKVFFCLKPIFLINVLSSY